MLIGRPGTPAAQRPISAKREGSGEGLKEGSAPVTSPRAGLSQVMYEHRSSPCGPPHLSMYERDWCPNMRAFADGVMGQAPMERGWKHTHYHTISVNTPNQSPRTVFSEPSEHAASDYGFVCGCDDRYWAHYKPVKSSGSVPFLEAGRQWRREFWPTHREHIRHATGRKEVGL